MSAEKPLLTEYPLGFRNLRKLLRTYSFESPPLKGLRRSQMLEMVSDEGLLRLDYVPSTVFTTMVQGEIRFPAGTQKDVVIVSPEMAGSVVIGRDNHLFTDRITRTRDGKMPTGINVLGGGPPENEVYARIGETDPATHVQLGIGTYADIRSHRGTLHVQTANCHINTLRRGGEIIAHSASMTVRHFEPHTSIEMTDSLLYLPNGLEGRSLIFAEGNSRMYIPQDKIPGHIVKNHAMYPTIAILLGAPYRPQGNQNEDEYIQRCREANGDEYVLSLRRIVGRGGEYFELA